MTNLPTRILVTDDDPLALKATSRLLTSAGYEVFSAINGEETLRMVEEHHPDMMLLDVVMPDIEGTEICRRLKADAHTADIFVILLSGVRTSSDEQSQGMEGGADGYIARPIANRELLARIQSYIRIKTAEQKLQEYARKLEGEMAGREKAEQEIASLAKFPSENPYPILRLSRDGIILYANTASKDLLKMWDSAVDTYAPPFLSDLILHALKSGQNNEIDIECADKVFSFIIIPIAEENYVNLYGRDTTGRKQAETALRASELKYRSLIESSSDAIFCVDEKGQYQFANQLFASTFGKTPDYFIGKTFWDIYPKEHADHRFEATKRVFQTGESESLDVEVPLPDKTLFFYATANPIKDETGKVILVLTHAVDITARKQTEAQLAHLHQQFDLILSSAAEGILGLDLEGKHTFVNPAAAKMLGYEVEELIGNPSHNIWHYAKPDGSPYPEDECNIRATYQDGTAQRADSEVFWRKNGKSFPVEYASTPIYEEDKITGAVVTFTDITARKQAEQTLRESEERLELVMDGSQLGFWDWNIETGEVYRNARWAEMLGYTLEEVELTVKQWSHLQHPDDQAAAWKSIQDHLEGRTPAHRIEYRMLAKDGQYKWILDQARIVKRDAQGKPLRMSGTHTDITERKQAEKELDQSHDLLTNLARLAPGVIYQYRLYPDGRSAFPYSSPGINNIYEVTPEEVREDATPVFGRLHPDDYNRVADSIQESARTLDMFYCEFRVILPRQGLRWRWSQAQPERMDDGGTLWYGTISDITERKLAEEANRQFNEQLSIVVDIEHSLAASLEQELIHANLLKGVQRLFPDVATIFISNFDAEREMIQALRGLQDGEPVDVSALPEIQLAPEGVGTQSRAIRSRQPLIINSDLKKASQNVMSVQVPGVDDGRDTQSAIYVPMLAQDKVLGLIQCQSYSVNRFTEEDIRTLSLIANTAAVSIQNARLFETAQKEIRERKQTEESLQASEAQYRLLAEHMDDVVWLMDIKTNKFVYVSPSVYKLRGYTPEEVMSQPVSESLTPESGELIQQTLIQAFQFVHEGKEIPTMPVQIEQTCKDGTTVWTEAIANFIFDANGFPVQVIGLSRDITERKRVEAALRESEKRFVKIFQSSPIGIALTDIISANVFDANDAFAEIWGYAREELVGHSTTELRLWEFPEERKAALQDLMKNGFIKNYDIHAIKKSGERILVKFSAELIDLAEKKYLLGNYEDITEQVEANKRLRESELRFRQMAENIHEVFWIFDRQTYKHVYVNPVYEAMFDVSQEILNNDPDFFVKKVMPADQPVVLAALEKQKRGENTETEYRIRRADGSLRWVWDRSFPIHDENGKLVRTAGVATDITERKRADDEIRHRILELEMLYESGLTLNQLSSPEEIGEKIIELLEQKMDWHHTLIRLYNPQDATLEIIALNLSDVQNEHERHAAKERMGNSISRSGEGLSGWVVQNGQTVCSGDVNNDPRYKESYPDINSGLYVPIKLGKDVIGVISIESEKPDAFNEADERLVATLSNQAAIAIENARLNFGLEQRVKERTAEVQDLYENAPTGYHSLDANGVIMMINQTELNWLGYAREEIAGIKKFRDLCMPHSQQIFDENFPRFKAQGWINDLEFDVIRKDGSVFPVLLNATAVYDANGKFLNSRSTTFDITVRKRAEEAARKLSQAIEHSPASVVITNRDGVIEYVNPAFCEVTGYTRDEALGQNPRIIKSDIHSPEFYQAMWATLTAGQPWHGEFCNKHKSGELYWEYAAISPVKNEHGEITHYVAVKEDITERKKVEEALHESRDELSIANTALEKAAHLKDEFLASMSHELRTPLTGILGLSEILRLKTYGELNEKQIKAIKIIEESGHHLLDLINDILDLSKIEAGKLELLFAPCSLADICQASLQLTKGMAQQKHQHVRYSAPTEPVLIRADARRLKQILVNLLSNAVKFTAEEGELGLDVQADESERNVKLTVWDKGIGIRPEDMHKLFKPFTQIDGGLAREYYGTGLGLSLVQRLTRLHNGGIKVESIPGEGSRFTVILPWSSQNTTPIPYTPQRVTGNLSRLALSPRQSQFPLLMIADDNETVLQMMSDFLETQPYRVVKVRSGVELMARVAEYHPDIMLVDIQMPGMDGLEAIRRIRTHEDAQIAATPIIAVTALAMSGDRERCLEAGANEYMSKPVKLTELAKIIQKEIGKKQ